MDDDEISHWVSACCMEGLRDSAEGWVDDDLAFVTDWGFDVTELTGDVRIWQGEQDRFVPAAHGRWLGANIVHLAYFSNFGRYSVDLSAPGAEILSTVPGSSYEVLSGTSMATPHVTGVAALLAAQDPSRSWSQIRNLILAGTDLRPQLSETVTGGRLNAYNSLTCSNR